MNLTCRILQPNNHLFPNAGLPPMTEAIYLDHNATTTVRPKAADAVREALLMGGNASSVHRFGRLAHRVLEDARDAVATLVGCATPEVIFTSGGTEANNLALRGVANETVLVSAIEHVSVLSARNDVQQLSVDGNGLLDLEGLVAALDSASSSALVSVMLANNETGVIQPLAAISEIVHAHGGLLHCDAIQAAGKEPLDMKAIGADLLSLSAHKFGGPQGVGALIVREGLGLKPLICGGGQELRRRAGTENLPGIAGFAAAANEAQAELSSFARLAELRDRLEQRISDLAPVQVFGRDVRRLVNTSCFTMPGVNSETQVMGLDIAGLAVSAGSACSSGKVEPSHVLRAMDVDEAEAGSALRVSFGWDSHENDVDRFVDAWGSLYSHAGNNSNSQAMAG